MIQQNKRLYRSRNDRLIAGVMGGWARYLGLDPSFLRLAFVILVLFAALSPDVFLRLTMAFVLPLAPLAGALVEATDFAGLDRSLLRAAYFSASVLARFAPAVFLYVLMAIVVPLEPKSQVSQAVAAN